MSQSPSSNLDANDQAKACSLSSNAETVTDSSLALADDSEDGLSDYTIISEL